jgi:hypothetical protein
MLHACVARFRQHIWHLELRRLVLVCDWAPYGATCFALGHYAIEQRDEARTLAM